MTEPVDRRPSPETLDYEAARGELVETVRRLEAGAASLEESLALWERGEALADRCAAVLDGARARLDARVETVTTQDADGAHDGAGDAARDEARDGSGARSLQARGREDE